MASAMSTWGMLFWSMRLTMSRIGLASRAILPLRLSLRAGVGGYWMLDGGDWILVSGCSMLDALMRDWEASADPFSAWGGHEGRRLGGGRMAEVEAGPISR